jgi:glycosyltransferase involved in cell wall biosynthesis
MNSRSPLVSVLMPAYNAEQFIAEAIDSILAQTYTNWELIVINDGSTDRSREIVAAFTDSRIRLIDNEKNMGIVATLNRAIDAATGDYCARMDADDVCFPERLAVQVRFMERHPDCGICGTWSANSDGTTSKMHVRNGILKCCVIAQCPFVHPSVMLRTDLLKSVRYDSNFLYAEDYNLWENLSHRTRMANIPRRLLYYRIFDSSLSHVKAKEYNDSKNEILRRQLKRLNIVPTENEMLVHERMVPIKNFTGTLGTPYLNDLRQWMHRLWQANLETRLYPRASFSAWLWFRWLLACLFLKQKGKALSLRLPLSPKALWLLTEMIWEKVIK